MNIIERFLTANLTRSMKLMGEYKVTWKNKKLEVIQNGSSEGETLAPGGFMPSGDNLTILIPRSEFNSNDLPKKNDYIRDWNNVDWIVQSVNGGEVAVTLTLESQKRRSGAR